MTRSLNDSICRTETAARLDLSGLGICDWPADGTQNITNVDLGALPSHPASMMSVSKCPALPTNGSPFASSSHLAVGPTNIQLAFGSPTPNRRLVP